MILKKSIPKVFEILEKHYKNTRRTNLNRESKNSKNYTPYQTLISCLISLRVKDEISEKISKELFKVAKTPREMLKIPSKKLEKLIFQSGFYKNKAKAIRKASEAIINNHRGKVPDTKEELLEIYGIGPKTANIVLCFAYDQIVIPVDVNVHRVCNRLGWVKTGKNAFEKTEKELEKILPKRYWREINGIFILHGKNICVPISPFCNKCPLKKYCKKVGVKKYR